MSKRLYTTENKGIDKFFIAIGIIALSIGFFYNAESGEFIFGLKNIFGYGICIFGVLVIILSFRKMRRGD